MQIFYLETMAKWIGARGIHFPISTKKGTQNRGKESIEAQNGFCNYKTHANTKVP